MKRFSIHKMRCNQPPSPPLPEKLHSVNTDFRSHAIWTAPIRIENLLKINNSTMSTISFKTLAIPTCLNIFKLKPLSMHWHLISLLLSSYSMLPSAIIELTRECSVRLVCHMNMYAMLALSNEHLLHFNKLHTLSISTDLFGYLSIYHVFGCNVFLRLHNHSDLRLNEIHINPKYVWAFLVLALNVHIAYYYEADAP